MPLSSRLATFFGIGRIPIASGTFASAAALPFAIPQAMFGWQAMAVVAAITSAVGVWACGKHAAKLGIKDPSECVLDEVAGQWIALIPVALYSRPLDWRPYVMGFLLFRLFDILKAWPLSAAERLPGGLGIMADDLLAGMIAGALLYATLAIGLV